MTDHIDLDTITERLADQLQENAKQWFVSSIALIKHSNDLQNDLLNCSARARRLCASSDIEIQVGTLTPWSTADWVRICFLHTALAHVQNHSTDSRTQCISDYYRYGDEHEKACILKALQLLDTQGTAVNVALTACRANSLQVLEAITLYNDYPAKHFADLNWNQLVLKALFLDLNISYVQGLEQRMNSKLSQMTYSYAQEQILADRSPPSSIWLAMRLKDLPHGANHLFNEYLSHSNTEHRDMINRSIQMHRQTL